MIKIDPNKVRHVTEPGCFGDMSQDYDCITLSYARELESKIGRASCRERV